jgi:hypothetical protein
MTVNSIEVSLLIISNLSLARARTQVRLNPKALHVSFIH